MGTRSVTVLTHEWVGQDSQHDASIYRHWDGYLDGHGQWLADFLKDVEVTNGKQEGEKLFNGPGRLASGIVHKLVEDGHDPSLQEQGIDCGQEYEYHVHTLFSDKGGSINVTVLKGPITMFGCGGEECTKQIFRGTPLEFSAFITENKREDDGT